MKLFKENNHSHAQSLGLHPNRTRKIVETQCRYVGWWDVLYLKDILDYIFGKYAFVPKINSCVTLYP